MNAFYKFQVFTLVVLVGKCCCIFQKGKRLGNPFAVLKGPYGLKQCITECLLRQQCQFVGYYNAQLRCDLGKIENIVNTTNQEFSVAAREDLAIYQNLLGNCAHHSCYTGRKCEVMNTGLLQCITTDCGSPPVVSNASLSFVQNMVGMHANYTCHSGTSLVGNATLICKANGQWSDVSFECKPDCGLPPVVSNASLSFAQNMVGMHANYTCHSGTSLVGNATLTCKANGQWSDVSFECKRVEVCSDTEGYVTRSSENSNICVKLYSIGSRSTLYSTAVQQCEDDGGRLVILDQLWKADAIRNALPVTGAFIVNGERNDGGIIKTSDGKDFIQFTGYTYDISSGKYITLHTSKNFKSRPDSQRVYGFICEKYWNTDFTHFTD